MLDLRYQPFVALVVPAGTATIEIGERLTCLDMAMFAWHSMLNPVCESDICSCWLRVAHTIGAHSVSANDSRPLNTVRLRDGRFVSEPDGIRSLPRKDT